MACLTAEIWPAPAIQPGFRAPMDLMDSTHWLRYFEINRLDRPEPHWHLPSSEDAITAAKLARSLSHFQLGESGEGTFLLAEARRASPDDPEYVEALALFIGEEQEHARLLEHLVSRFSGTLILRHWTHGCFRLLRRALGVGFEIQTLVVAELIGTAYYRLMRIRARDPVLVQVCDLMLRDEARHIEFHSQRVAPRQTHWRTLGRALWAAQFQILFLGAMHLAWLDHHPALTAVGAERREFLREARRGAAAFLAALAGGEGRSYPAESPFPETGAGPAGR